MNDYVYIGTVILWAPDFAPNGWAFCNGQELSIAENSALFALIGNTYGGDGATTFALPDLRSRVPMGTGQGNGLSAVKMGEQAGAETVALTSSNMPAHTHSAKLTSLNIPVDSDGSGLDSPNPAAGVLANTGTVGYSSVSNGNYNNGADITGIISVSTEGGNQPFSIRTPYLGMNYIICLEGIFPKRY